MPASVPDGPELNKHIWKIYREFFDMAERRRRWTIERDIPWDQCNPNTPREIADVVETFCAVELFLPDYVGKALPMARTFGWRRGRKTATRAPFTSTCAERGSATRGRRASSRSDYFGNG